MERSQKRLIDKVSSFFQRRWWRKPNRTTDQPQERLAAFVPEIETVTVPKPGTIIKQDSAVSVSSTNKTGHVFDGLNEDLQLPAVLTAPIVNLSLTESSENSSPLRRRSTQRRQSQISKQTFRQIRVPLQSESDSNSDVVSDLLHGVEAMNLKNKSTIRKSRTLLRNRRTSNKRYFSGVRQASELAAKLSECSFRSVSASEIKEVRQCLQNADHQWEVSFLNANGYEALNFMLWEIVSSTNRQCLNEQLYEISQCYKLLLTNSLGRKAVFSNLQPIYLIRDLLLGSIERDKLAGFSIETRLSLLEVLSQLQTIDIELGIENTNPGYKLLYELLSDSPIDNDVASSIPNLPGTNLINRSLPIRKAKSSHDMRSNATRLKFSSWMHELQITVDQSIKPASFLTGVLDYHFDNSPLHFSQKSLPPTPDQGLCHQSYMSHDLVAQDANGQKTLMSLVDNTTIIYLNTHLKLMRKIIDCPPIQQPYQYGPLEKENVRREFLKSGFSSIAASLLACPYPDLRNSYIDELTPLLHS